MTLDPAGEKVEDTQPMESAALTLAIRNGATEPKQVEIVRARALGRG